MDIQASARGRSKARSRGRKAWILGATLLVVTLVGANVAAYLHAGAMLRFDASGAQTRRPEELRVLDKLTVLLTGVSIPRPVNDRDPSSVGLAFETVHFDTSDGHTLEAWHIERPGPSSSTGPPPKGLVVLFHGYAAPKSTMLPYARAFHGAGYACLLVDFRGSGGSTGSATTIGHDEARDVIAAAAWARARTDGPLILFGHSMGAAAVLRAASPRATGQPLEADALVVEAVFGTMLSAVRGRFDVMGVPAWPFAELLVFWGGVQSGFSAFEHNPLDYARDVTLPTLFLHGADDRRAPVDEVRTMHASMGATAELAVFEGVEHESLYHRDGERWVQTVEAFLTGL